MICPDCYLGYMQRHEEYQLQHIGWLKCPLCAFCCKEVDLVQYRKDGKSKEIEKLREIARERKKELAYYKRALNENKRENRELLLQISELTRQLEYQASKKNTPVFHTGHTCEPLEQWTGPSSFNPPCKICGRVMK